MNYTELKRIFWKLKTETPRENMTAHIIFTEDSFTRPFPLLSRTYLVSSDNKGFWPRMFSNSIFAYCLDKNSDQGVRLDWYMAEEGNKDGWKVEDCYILEHMRDAAAIPRAERTEQEDGTVCWFFGDTCIQAREATDTEHEIHVSRPRVQALPTSSTRGQRLLRNPVLQRIQAEEAQTIRQVYPRMEAPQVVSQAH